MITIRLNWGTVITFDGRVVEVFPDFRIHIGMLKDIVLATDRHGKHTLRVGDVHSTKETTVDEEAVQKVNQFISEVKRAQAEFKFD